CGLDREQQRETREEEDRAPKQDSRPPNDEDGSEGQHGERKSETDEPEQPGTGDHAKQPHRSQGDQTGEGRVLERVGIGKPKAAGCTGEAIVQKEQDERSRREHGGNGVPKPRPRLDALRLNRINQEKRGEQRYEEK